jgi:hypothetical protein
MDDKLHIDWKFDKKVFILWMKSIHYLGRFELGTMVPWELGPVSHGTTEIFPRNLGSSYGSMRTWVQLPMQT